MDEVRERYRGGERDRSTYIWIDIWIKTVGENK